MHARSKPFDPRRPSVAELAAGALIVPPDRSPRVLVLHERSEDRWCFPKGHVEPGESIHAAAEREVREETGLRDAVGQDELGTVHYRFYQPRKRRNVLKTVVYFLGRARSVNLRLEPGFDAAAWLSVPAARRRLARSTDREILQRFEETLRPTRRKSGRPHSRD